MCIQLSHTVILFLFSCVLVHNCADHFCVLAFHLLAIYYSYYSFSSDGECSYGEVCLTVDQDNAQVCVNGTWEDVLDENCSVFANKTALCVYSVAHSKQFLCTIIHSRLHTIHCTDIIHRRLYTYSGTSVLYVATHNTMQLNILSCFRIIMKALHILWSMSWSQKVPLYCSLYQSQLFSLSLSLSLSLSHRE